MGFWLVTWEWDGDHAARDNNIAAILNWRLSEEKVRQLVELIYANEQFTLSERLSYAKNKHNTPYPAQFNGMYSGQIVCGGNPFLYARLADDIKVDRDLDGIETLTWTERPIPTNVTKLIELSRKNSQDK